MNANDYEALSPAKGFNNKTCFNCDVSFFLHTQKLTKGMRAFGNVSLKQISECLCYNCSPGEAANIHEPDEVYQVSSF